MNTSILTTEPREYDAAFILSSGAAMEAVHREEVISLKEMIGNRLGSLRQSHGIPLVGMAALIGSNRGTLFVAESPRSSKRSLSFEKLAEIERAYFAAVSVKNQVEIVTRRERTNTHENTGTPNIVP